MKNEVDIKESGKTTHGVQVTTVKVYSTSGKRKRPGDIIFRCKLCNKKYRLSEDFAGIAAECAKCKKVLVVPRHSDIPEDSLQDKIVFRCHECSQKYRLAKIYANQKARCSRCHSVFIIPEQSESAQSGPVFAQAPETRNERNLDSSAEKHLASQEHIPQKNTQVQDDREEIVPAAQAARNSRTQTAVEITEDCFTVVKYVLVQPDRNIFESVFRRLIRWIQQIMPFRKIQC